MKVLQKHFFFFLCITLFCNSFASQTKGKARKTQKKSPSAMQAAGVGHGASAAQSAQSADAKMQNNDKVRSDLAIGAANKILRDQLMAGDPSNLGGANTNTQIKSNVLSALNLLVGVNQISGAKTDAKVSSETAAAVQSSPKDIVLDAQQTAERDYRLYGFANALEMVDLLTKKNIAVEDNPEHFKFIFARENMKRAAIRLCNFYKKLSYSFADFLNHIKKHPKIVVSVHGIEKAIVPGMLIIKFFECIKQTNPDFKLEEAIQPYYDAAKNSLDEMEPVLTLIDSVRCNDLKRVGELGQQNVANTPDYNQATPLFYAAVHNNYPMVELLHTRGAELNVKDRFGVMPLLVAHKYTQGNDDERVCTLLKSKSNINFIDPQGDTPLTTLLTHFARNIPVNTEIFNAFIAHNVDLKIRNKKGDTPLMLAIRTEENQLCVSLWDIIETRGEERFNLNAHNHAGENPLIVADLLVLTDCCDNAIDCSNGVCDHKAIQALMLLKSDRDNGFDIDALDADGNTALMVACERGYLDVVNALLARGANTAARNVKQETAAALAQKGLDRCKKEATAAAAQPVSREQSHYEEILHALKSATGQSGKLRGKSSTASDLKARGEGKKDVAEQVRNAQAHNLRYLAFLNAVLTLDHYSEKAKKSPLCYRNFVVSDFAVEDTIRTAQQYISLFKETNIGYEATMKYLQSQKAPSPEDVSVYTLFQKMEIYIPRYNGAKLEQIVRELFDAAQVKPQSEAAISATIFTHAVKAKQMETIKSMLKNNRVPSNVCDQFGCPVILYASAYGYPEVVTLLLQRGWDPNVSDAQGRTAFLLASDKAMEDILKRPNNKMKLDFEATNALGDTAYLTATSAGSEFVCKAIEEVSPKSKYAVNLKTKKSALTLAIDLCKPGIITWLVSDPVFSLVEHDSWGRQPFIYASLLKNSCALKACSEQCMHGMILTQLAVSGGTSCIDRVGKDGLTSLMVACREGQPDVVKDIMKYRGDVKITINKKRAWHYAQEGLQRAKKNQKKPYEKVIALLTEAGALAYEEKCKREEDMLNAQALKLQQAQADQKRLEQEQLETKKAKEREEAVAKKEKEKKDKKKQKKDLKKQAEAALDALLDAPIAEDLAKKVKHFQSAKLKGAVNQFKVVVADNKRHAQLMSQADALKTVARKRTAIVQLKRNNAIAQEQRDSKRAQDWYAARILKKSAMGLWKKAVIAKEKAMHNAYQEELKQWTLSKAKVFLDQHAVIALPDNYLNPLIGASSSAAKSQCDYFGWLDSHLNQHITSFAHDYLWNKENFKTSRIIPQWNCSLCNKHMNKESIVKFIDTNQSANDREKLHWSSFAHAKSFHKLALKVKLEAFQKIRAEIEKPRDQQRNSKESILSAAALPFKAKSLATIKEAE